jgi:hypothetical protein
MLLMTRRTAIATVAVSVLALAAAGVAYWWDA